MNLPQLFRFSERKSYRLLSLSGLLALNLGLQAASELTFDSSGQPTSFVLGDVNRLGQSGRDRFSIRKGKTNVGLESVTTTGDSIEVVAKGGSPKFTLRLEPHPRHLVVHLEGVSGVPAFSDWVLHMNLSANDAVGVKTFDNHIKAGFTNSDWLYISWPYSWERRSNGSYGSVALYNGALEGDELDAALAEIWSKATAENMPRPAGQSSWSEADVRNWVNVFDKKFSNLSEVMLEAESEEELYALTDQFLLPNPVKRVYLHTRTWRGGYWPNAQGIDAINLKVFPKGKEDLKAYADHLHSHGILLKLHNVSCGIGLNDPDYVVGGIDRRVAGWGGATLTAAIGADDKTIRIKPDQGTIWPPHYPPGNLDVVSFVRIGEEIVHVKNLSDTDTDEWTLSGCVRGFGGTEATAHQKKTEVGGLYCPYRRNLVPADDLAKPNSLMNEMALKMSNLINYVGADHIHFDGIEIHDINPWARRHLTSRIYSYTDHPVTSSAVGRIISANFEYDFSGPRDNASLGYFPLNVDLRTERKKSDDYRNLATSILHSHFHVQDLLAIGGRRVELGRAESGRGITRKLLEDQGLREEVLWLWRAWLELSPIFHEDDAEYVAGFLTKTPGSNHYQGEDVLVLSLNSDNQYVFTPHHAMGREGDVPWKVDQEWGAIPRQQIITTGTSLRLINPGEARDLNFIIRNTYETDTIWTNPSIAIQGGGTLKVAGSVKPGEYLEYNEGATANLYDYNWNSLGTLPVEVESGAFAVPAGTAAIQVNGDGEGSPKVQTQFILKGEPYVLKTNEALSGERPGPVQVKFENAVPAR